MGALAEDVFKSGSLTAASTGPTGVLEMANPALATVMVQLTGTWTATVAFEVNVDQGDSPTWVAVNALNVGTGLPVSSATANGIYRFDASGAREVRVHCTAFTSGPIVVTMNGTVATASGNLAAGSSGGVTDTELPPAVTVGDNVVPADSPTVIALTYGFDGTNWDRQVTFPGAADGRNTTNTGALVQSFGYGFNGTTWDRLRVASSSVADLRVAIAGTGGSADNLTNSYGAPTDQAGTSRPLGVTGLLWSGSAWERPRNNIDVTALASASRTTTQTVSVTNYNGRAIHVVLSTTVIGTGSITLSIEGVDSVSGATYVILTGAAVVTNTTNVYKVGPGLTAAANSVANDFLPRTFNIKVTANNANAATYSVGYSLMCA